MKELTKEQEEFLLDMIHEAQSWNDDNKVIEIQKFLEKHGNLITWNWAVKLAHIWHLEVSIRERGN